MVLQMLMSSSCGMSGCLMSALHPDLCAELACADGLKPMGWQSWVLGMLGKSGDERSDPALFSLSRWHLTHESQPRFETAAASSRNQENYRSYENQRRDSRLTALPRVRALVANRRVLRSAIRQPRLAI